MSSACNIHQVESQARAYHVTQFTYKSFKSTDSNYSISRVSYVYSPNHFTIENQNAFARSADFEFELILYSRIETARHLVRSDFLQRSIRRRVPRVKKNDEIQKEHTHLSLSLSLSLSNCRSADGMFTLMCLHQSLSLSLSLTHICKHGLDPDQTRMVFRIERFVNLKMCACGRKYAKR